jgi:hypothetical protein
MPFLDNFETKKRTPVEPDDIKMATLSPEDLATIRALEKKLGDDICLVAVKKKDVLYALEAKVSPGCWRLVDEVYPEIDRLRAYYDAYDQAKDAKAALKSYLISQKSASRVNKRPIRIRQIVQAQD